MGEATQHTCNTGHRSSSLSIIQSNRWPSKGCLAAKGLARACRPLPYCARDVLKTSSRHVGTPRKMWSGRLGIIKGVSLDIELKHGTGPLLQQPFLAGQNPRELIDVDVNKLLAVEVIEMAQRDWVTLLVIAPEKDGTPRFCVDYRKLDEVTIPDSYPIARMDDSIGSLGDSTVYSAFDANWGYWQLPIAKEGHEKTMVVTHRESLRWI